MKHLYTEHIARPGDPIAFNSAVLILAYAGKVALRYISTGMDLVKVQATERQFASYVRPSA